MKLDYVKVITLGMAVMSAVKAAADDGKITVGEVIDIACDTAHKVAEVVGILDKPLWKIDTYTTH